VLLPFAQRLVCLLLLLLVAGPLRAQATFTPSQNQQDFDYFWTTVKRYYCYFDKKQTDWDKVRQQAEPQLKSITTRAQFVRLLENALNELYDNHASLSTNLPDSRRLIPTATDMWGAFVGGKPVLVDVRRGYGTEQVGLRPGMEVAAINDLPVDQAIRPLLGQSLKTVDAAARQMAFNLALAGDHRTPRKLTVLVGGKKQDFYPDKNGLALENIRYAGLLESKRLGTVGYIKINNSLGNNALIAAFDSALTALSDTQGFILDLRECPSGGNTTVARAIMGRFITQEQPYQRHELTAEELAFGVKRTWIELVSPRPNPYTKPLIVLVGRWTGSMPEGITIGLESMKRATIMGTEMARLNGAISSFRMPNSGIGFSIPAERLYRIDGLPRENYVPQVVIPPSAGGSDKTLEAALLRLPKSTKP
jgi:C-terminal processing protease CtpA/Prc